MQLSFLHDPGIGSKTLVVIRIEGIVDATRLVGIQVVRRDRQIAGDTPPGGVGAKDRARDRQFSAGPQLSDGNGSPIERVLIPAN